MATSGKGKFVNRPTSTGGKKYPKYFIYVPADVARDSQFPLAPGQEVAIRFDAKTKRVIVEPA